MAFLLFRIALVAGAVYATQELGIWDGPDRSVVLYENAKREMRPMAEELMDRFCCWHQDKSCMDKVIEVKSWRESMVDAWNDTVKKSFHLVGIDMPIYYHRFADDLGHTIDDLSKD